MHGIDLRRVDLNLLVVFDDLMHTRSVTETARRLHKTQPAISHALQRLRQQLDDPLLVKQGRDMVPSPHAQVLIESVRPLLAGIGLALAPPPPFVPATTTRRFRIAAPDFAHSLLPMLIARLREEAPLVTLDWLAVHGGMLRTVVDGGIDLAVSPALAREPVSGLGHAELTPLLWATYLRPGHRAARRWGLDAWRAAEHIQVVFGDRLDNPVSHQTRRQGVERKIAVRVPNLSMVAPLIASSDMIATMPVVVMVDAVERYRLVVRRPPVAVPPMPHRVYWSARLDKDPALNWFRGHVQTVFDGLIRQAHSRMPRVAMQG